MYWNKGVPLALVRVFGDELPAPPLGLVYAPFICQRPFCKPDEGLATFGAVAVGVHVFSERAVRGPGRWDRLLATGTGFCRHGQRVEQLPLRPELGTHGQIR